MPRRLRRHLSPLLLGLDRPGFASLRAQEAVPRQSEVDRPAPGAGEAAPGVRAAPDRSSRAASSAACAGRRAGRAARAGAPRRGCRPAPRVPAVRRARCPSTAAPRLVEGLQPRHRRDRQLPGRGRPATTCDARARRSSSTRPRPRSRRSSIPTRAPTSSSRSARKASRSRRASSRFPTLPGRPAAEGRARCAAAFGKVNAMHNHVLPWTDRPLVTHEPAGRRGGDRRRRHLALAAHPEPVALPGGDRRGLPRRVDDVFATPERRRPHLRRTPARATATSASRRNLDLGGSFAYGRQRARGRIQRTRLVGVDVTFRYRPLRRAIYRASSRAPRSSGAAAKRPRTARRDAFGVYVSAEYQFARRWFAGRALRLRRARDRTRRWRTRAARCCSPSGRASSARCAASTGAPATAKGTTANEFLFQLLFSIGAHGAHAF